MQQPPTRKMHDVYLRGLFWIIREHAGNNGGWPPRDVDKVCGWAVIRMLAAMTHRSPREIAAEVIEHSMHLDGA